MTTRYYRISRCPEHKLVVVRSLTRIMKTGSQRLNTMETAIKVPYSMPFIEADDKPYLIPI